jgi:hypothetical protein
MENKLNDNIIQHLLDVFKLQTQQGYKIQDCVPILIKPIFLFDMAMEIFASISVKQLNKEELKHFKIIKKNMNDFERHLFNGLNDEDKNILSDSMSEFIDYLSNDVNLLENSFYSFLGDRYDIEYKKILSQLYVLSTLCQIVALYLTSVKHIKAKGFPLIDVLNKTAYRVLRTQRLLDIRINKTKLTLNPNIDNNIKNHIDLVITNMYKYFE